MFRSKLRFYGMGALKSGPNRRKPLKFNALREHVTQCAYLGFLPALNFSFSASIQASISFRIPPSAHSLRSRSNRSISVRIRVISPGESMAVLVYGSAPNNRGLRSILISAQLLASSNLFMTVQRRHLWVVTLSQKHLVQFAPSQSISPSIYMPTSTARPFMSTAT